MELIVLLKFAGDTKVGGIVSVAEDEDIRQEDILSRGGWQCDKLQKNKEQHNLKSNAEKFALKPGNFSAGNENEENALGH